MESTALKVQSRVTSVCLVVIGASIGVMLMSAGVTWSVAVGFAIVFLVGAAVAERRLAQVDDLHIARGLSADRHPASRSD